VHVLGVQLRAELADGVANGADLSLGKRGSLHAATPQPAQLVCMRYVPAMHTQSLTNEHIMSATRHLVLLEVGLKLTNVVVFLLHCNHLDPSTALPTHAVC
jgi:hypothetical protein